MLKWKKLYVVIDPLNLKSEDIFEVVEYATGAFDIIDLNKHDEPQLDFKVKEKFLKHLPVKSVLVKSKDPYIRTHQHYKPKTSSLLSLSLALRTSKKIDHKINHLINNLPENIPEKKLQPLLEKYKEKLHTAGGDISSLNLTKKINGEYLFTRLIDYKTTSEYIKRFADTKHINYQIAKHFDDIPIDDYKSLSTDARKALFRFYEIKSKMIPASERNKYLDSNFRKFMNGNTIYSIIKDTILGYDEGNPYKGSLADMGTAIDFLCDNVAEDKAASVLAKMLKAIQQKHNLIFPEDKIRNLMGEVIAGARNPKKVTNVLSRIKRLPRELSSILSTSEVASKMINDWIASSNNYNSILIRRSARALFLGDKRQSKFQDKYGLRTHYYVGELDRDKIPDDVIRGLSYIKSITDKYITPGFKLMDKFKLYRGLNLLHLPKNLKISPTVSSTSVSKDVASDFANTYDYVEMEPKENLDHYPIEIDNSTKKYLTHFYHSLEEGGLLLEFDGKKLAADGRILAVLTPSTAKFYERNGVHISQTREMEVIVLF